jgi:hypothetical protein
MKAFNRRDREGITKFAKKIVNRRFSLRTWRQFFAPFAMKALNAEIAK